MNQAEQLLQMANMYADALREIRDLRSRNAKLRARLEELEPKKETP